MSKMTPEYWKMIMGDMKMPDGCTSEQMWAMRHAIDAIEYKDTAAENIAFYESALRRWYPRYKAVEKIMEDADGNTFLTEDYQTEWESLQGIMKTCKEQILIWRKELTQ